MIGFSLLYEIYCNELSRGIYLVFYKLEIEEPLIFGHCIIYMDWHLYGIYYGLSKFDNKFVIIVVVVHFIKYSQFVLFNTPFKAITTT